MDDQNIFSTQNNAWLMEYITLVMRLNNVSSRWAYDKGMPFSHMLTLFELCLHPEGREPSALADGICMPRQSMTYILESLDSQGYLVREGNPRDRRRKVVRVTAEGIAFAKGAIEELSWAVDTFLNQITQDKEQLLRLTRQYINALEAQIWPPAADDPASP